MIFLDDWRCDRHKWEHFGRKLLKTEPVVCKTYYKYSIASDDATKDFKRYSYAIPDRMSNVTVIHYKGNDAIANDYPPHVKTCSSVLRKLETTMQLPSVVYKKSISNGNNTPLGSQPVLQPRNKKQVSNFQQLSRQRFRMSHDALYNLHELSYDIPDFVHKIVTFPDLIIICGVKRFLTECNRLLVIHSTLSNVQILSYDTTFQLGDFYVSPLLFRNTLFQKSPVMPVLFVIHERKLKTTHNEMMAIVAQEIPFLTITSARFVPIVTDDEKGFFEAVECNLHNVRRFLCWNHVINAVKFWLRKHGATASEVPVYVSDMRDLFHQESEIKYYERLEELKVKWSEAFLQYYQNELNEKASAFYSYVIDYSCIYY